MDENTPIIQKNEILERIAYIALGLIAFLLPFFFIPSQAFSFQSGKGLLFALGVVVAFAFYVISLIRNGTISFPKNLLFLSILLLPLVYLISSIANGGDSIGLIGFGFELGTASFMLLSVVFLFLVSELFKSKEKIFYSYLGFFTSLALVAFFQFFRLIVGTDFLSLGIFTSGASNLVGNWNDLGIFFGVSVILSLITLEMLQLKKLFKFLVYVAFIISIIFLAIVNFSTVWIVLGILSLVIFIYLASFDKFSPSPKFADSMATEEIELKNNGLKKRISYNALVLLIISLLFIISGNTLGEKISEITNVVNVEVRPAWSATYSVLKETLRSSPLVGSGPNTFSNMWLLHKPVGINDSIFWDTDFSYGIGLIPTFFVTTGLLGILAWLFFLVMFVYSGIRAIFQQTSDSFSRYIVTSSFLIALFLWIMSVVYVPTVAIFALTFFFTGLFVASLYREGLLKRKELLLANHPRLSFVSILVLVILLLGSVSLGYLVLQKSTSLAYFQKSILEYQKNQNIDSAESKMLSATKLGGYDIYYRGLSELSLIRVDSILARPGATPESIRDEFQLHIGKSIDNARKATEISPQNYQNWVSLARVYAALVPPPFAIPGAYENALKTYEQALAVNPHSPSILLLLARLEVSNNNLKGAREFVNKSLAEKQNYAEAHFLLAQIEVSEGNVAKAIPSLETTAILSPNNPGLYFQLGLLKYNVQDFNGAAVAFLEAIKIVPDYANAKYFLGLTLYQLDEVDEAIAQFTDLEKTNPDNQEVKVILSNLKAGKEPFANARPPITNTPEKRDKLPIEQTN